MRRFNYSTLKIMVSAGSILLTVIIIACNAPAATGSQSIGAPAGQPITAAQGVAAQTPVVELVTTLVPGTSTVQTVPVNSRSNVSATRQMLGFLKSIDVPFAIDAGNTKVALGSIGHGGAGDATVRRK
jgi:hypothetical protein